MDIRINQSFIVFITSALALGSGCGKGDDQIKLPPRPPATVSIAEAGVQDVPIYIDEIGKTEALDSVTIMPQVGGKIVSAHFEDGAYVKQGALLFEIDPRSFEAAVHLAQATLLQRQAELNVARSEFHRVEGLIDRAAVSQSQFDQRKASLAVAEAQVSAAQATLDNAKLNLEYTKIYSPLDGRAGAGLIDPGNVVKANETPLLTIERIDPISTEFTVSESDFSSVRKYAAASGLNFGDSPEHALKVLIDVPGDSQRIQSVLGSPKPDEQARSRVAPREGTLNFLDNRVQAGSGTVKLRATVSNGDHYLWPGQFVNVRLVLTTKKQAVLVPSQAVQISQQGQYVYVIKPDNTAELRVIRPGQKQGDLTVVDSGLQPGEKVVIAGHLSVAPGGPVTIAEATQTPAAMKSGS